MRNLGVADRGARAVLGAVLLYLAFLSGLPVFEQMLPFWLAFLGGVIMLGTSAISFCPLYRLFGFKTCQEC